MNELREEMAMCAHMRVNHKRVLLDGTESGRIRDSWVCEDCGTLFVPLLAANREQKATLADRDNHIDLAYKALGDVNRSVYLFDHIREQKAEIERLTGCLKQANAGMEEYERKYYLELNRGEQLEAELLRASVGEKWVAYSESKPAYGETVEVLFSGPEIALCRREQEELAEDDMREPDDILWDINGDQERSVMGIFWRKFAPPTLPGEEK